LEALLIEGLNAYIRYHDLTGDEPALVFIHGLGSASSSWFPRILRHSILATRRAVLVDLLGFGFSDRPSKFRYSMEDHADTVASLLDHLNLKRCAVIGHSMGGSIATVLATARPDLVSNLIVAEGNLDPGPGTVSGPITAQTEEQFTKNGYAAFLRGVISEGWADYAGTVQASDPRAMHRNAVSLIAERHPTFREQLLALSIPRTFIFGESSLGEASLGENTTAHPDVQQLSKDRIRVEIVENAGHDMMSDNPDGFAQAIAKSLFLQGFDR
jgi:pimeloyl-ACP methyl ester carboxylesterase